QTCALPIWSLMQQMNCFADASSRMGEASSTKPLKPTTIYDRDPDFHFYSCCIPWIRTDLQGPLAVAHAVDVGVECDFWNHHCRRDGGGGRRRWRFCHGARISCGDFCDNQRGRRLSGDGPDAGDVPQKEKVR